MKKNYFRDILKKNKNNSCGCGTVIEEVPEQDEQQESCGCSFIIEEDEDDNTDIDLGRK